MKNRSFGIFCGVTLILALGCSGGYESNFENASTSFVRRPSHELAQEDIASFEGETLAGPKSPFLPAMEKLFGGNEGKYIGQYVKERAKLFIEDSDTTASSIPSTFRYTGWTSRKVEPTNPKSRAAAANWGTQLWFQGLLDEAAVSVRVRGATIPITSSRSGVFILGKLYTDYQNEDGVWYEISRSFRKMLLVHESRHSDCTNGVRAKDLQIARDANSIEEFIATFPHLSCGHHHAFCPDSHELKGEHACDARPWEAYAMAWLYAEVKSETYGKEWSVMNALAIDNKSRLLYNTNDLLSGKLGDPDMSQQELYH